MLSESIVYYSALCLTKLSQLSRSSCYKYATTLWHLKKKKAAKREKRPRRGGGGSNRTTAVWLHSVERGGGRGDRGQWLVQGLRFELKFDAAPRRRFLP